MLKPFGSVNALIPEPVQLQAGRYDFVEVRVYGVPGVSQPNFTNEIRLKKNGITKINFPFNRMLQVSDLLYGKPRNDFVAQTSFAQTILIPFSPINQVNAMHVVDNTEWTLEFDAFGSGIASGTVKVLGYQSFAIQRFAPLISFTSKALTGHAVLNLAMPNLTGVVLFLSAGATEPETVLVRRKMPDGSTMEFNAHWQDLLDCSNYLARIEATAETGVFVDLNPTRDFSEALSDGCDLELVGGSGTFYVLAIGWQFDTARAAVSQLTVQREYAARVAALPVDVQEQSDVVLGVARETISAPGLV